MGPELDKGEAHAHCEAHDHAEVELEQNVVPALVELAPELFKARVGHRSKVVVQEHDAVCGTRGGGHEGGHKGGHGGV